MAAHGSAHGRKAVSGKAGTRYQHSDVSEVDVMTGQEFMEDLLLRWEVNNDMFWEVWLT